jgi:hypothetical protein
MCAKPSAEGEKDIYNGNDNRNGVPANPFVNKPAPKSDRHKEFIFRKEQQVIHFHLARDFMMPKRYEIRIGNRSVNVADSTDMRRVCLAGD